VYFYSIQDGEVLGKVKNNTTKDYGCTNLWIEKTGSGAFNLYQGRDGLHKVSDKVVRVEASLVYKGSNTVTFYYTEAQLTGLESASGHDRTEFRVYQVDAAAYTAAGSQNTKKYTAVYTPLAGVGGSYTITLNDQVNGSYALGLPVSILGQSTLQSRTGEAFVNRWQFGSLYPNPVTANASLEVTAPESQKFRIELINAAGQLVLTQAEQVQQGLNQLILKTARINRGNYLVRIRNEKEEVVYTQQFLKQ